MERERHTDIIYIKIHIKIHIIYIYTYIYIYIHSMCTSLCVGYWGAMSALTRLDDKSCLDFIQGFGEVLTLVATGVPSMGDLFMDGENLMENHGKSWKIPLKNG